MTAIGKESVEDLVRVTPGTESTSNVKAELGMKMDSFSAIRVEPDETKPGQVVPEVDQAYHESASRRISTAEAGALLLVFSLVISGIFAILPSYKEIFSADSHIVLMDNFVDLPQLPPGFHFLTLTTSTFVVCTTIICLVAWSQLDSHWIAFYLKACLLFVVAAIVVCYALLLQPLTLYLHISIRGDCVSGFWLLWLYSICTLIIWGTLVLIVKRSLSKYSESLRGNDKRRN